MSIITTTTTTHGVIQDISAVDKAGRVDRPVVISNQSTVKVLIPRWMSGGQPQIPGGYFIHPYPPLMMPCHHHHHRSTLPLAVHPRPLHQPPP